MASKGASRPETATDQELLEVFLQHIPDDIYFKDCDSRFVRISRALATRFGLSDPADAVGKSDFDMFTAEHAEQAFADEQEIIRTGRPVVAKEEKETWPDGHETWASTTKVPLRDRLGKIVGTVGISRDVTERRRAQHELHEYKKHLEELVAARTAELTRANNALASSNAELEKFAYVASHDLQEPLRMVASYTQLLARRYQGKLDADADEFIAFAVDGASRMQQLIQDLLSYSRLATQGQQLELIESQVACNTAVMDLRLSIEDSGAVVNIGTLPTVRADPAQLAQLFLNLIGNAIKYRNEHTPEIQVAARAESGRWVFSVQDNGIGIDSRYHSRIFEMFQRLHPREKYSGTGIGLAICKKIVDRHGGRIWVESRPGHGSTFLFTIPQIERTAE